MIIDHKVEEVVGPHDQMQVIMARGLFSKWKMPVYIDFDDKMTVLTVDIGICDKMSERYWLHCCCNGI